MEGAAPTLRTRRLLLRPLGQADAGDLARIGGQPDVARMLFSVQSPWHPQAVESWIERSRWHGRPGYRLGICLRDGTLIGVGGLGGEPLSCSYFLDPDFAGQGYATEAMGGLLADAFERFDLPEIVADHFADNPASGRILGKLGFEKTGTGMGESAARLEPAPNVHYRLSRHNLKA
jgi:RimJ/RimL family protein N-acetyltransferase